MSRLAPVIADLAGDDGQPGRQLADLLLVGGRQRHARAVTEQEPGWYKYAKGLVLRVGLADGVVEECIEYASPASVCPPDEPAILFKCASLSGNLLFACTQTEVLIYDLATWELAHYISLPIFNDVHHVLPTDQGTLLVAISGLDMVAEVTLDGRVVREWNTCGVDTWSRFSRYIDYRLVASTKPHLAHPNFLFKRGDDYWVTRFEGRDAINLNDPTQRIEIGLERVHDGVVDGERIYFTTVNGHLVIVDAESLAVERIVDLTAFHPPDVLLGWCRGVLVDGERVWVGFSRLRMTRFRQNLSWVRTGFRSQLPTRVDCYDLAAGRLVRSIDLQSRGLDAVFSVLPAPPR